jgi:hypothetical protein
MKTPVPNHPTVAIDTVLSPEDVPVLVFAPEGQIESLELRLLLAAIDGESSIRQIAEVAGVDPQHAQAVFAQLRSDGCISILHAARGPDSASAENAAVTARDPFQGLKPRTS